MDKGPIFIENHFIETNSETLGINLSFNNLIEKICPMILNTTSRAFYYPFVNWCYYDYYNNEKLLNEKGINSEEDYIKYINYFLALSSILNNDFKTDNFTGRNNIKSKIKNNMVVDSEVYKYDEGYIKSKNRIDDYSRALKEIGYQNLDNNNVIHITDKGKIAAEIFDNAFKTSSFYEHRHNVNDVNDDNIISAIEELYETLNINLTNQEDIKADLRANLLSNETEYQKRTTKCIDLITKLQIKNDTDIREKLFKNSIQNINDYPDLSSTIARFELAIAKQYVNTSIHKIWTMLLKDLEKPMNLEMWINSIITKKKFTTLVLKSNLSTNIDGLTFNFEKYDNCLNMSYKNSFENLLIVIFSVYNKFNNEKAKLSEALEFDSNIGGIMYDVFDKIDKYQNKPLKDFIFVLIDIHIIKQHQSTAFNKINQSGHDTYCISESDSLFIKIKDSISTKQDYRLLSLKSILDDLDIKE